MNYSLHGIRSGQMHSIICRRSVTFHETFIWSPHITHEYLCEQAFCILTVMYFIAQPIRMNCSTCIEIFFFLILPSFPRGNFGIIDIWCNLNLVFWPQGKDTDPGYTSQIGNLKSRLEQRWELENNPDRISLFIDQSSHP